LKKAIILCNDFPPINSIGAERPLSWYKYFRNFGIEPIVITKNWIPNNITAFNNISNERSVENTDLGTIIRSVKSSTPSLVWYDKFGLRISFIRKALTFGEKILSFLSIKFDQHKNIYKEARFYLKNNKVDIIITTGEPFLLFRYGYLLKKEFNIKWVADYRDGWYLNHVTSINKDIFTKLFRKYELIFEKKYSLKADLITTVDPHMASRLSKLLKQDVKVVYNGFWKYENDFIRIKNNKKLIISHTGTLTIGQRVETLLEALLSLLKENKISSNDIEVNFIGLNYFPKQVSRLENYHPLLKKIIKTTDRLSKEKATLRNLESDYLLNFTDPNLSAIYAKTYNYIACKRPILVIPDDNALLGKIITENNLGFAFNSKNELKKFIIEKIKQKKDVILDTKLLENENLNIFKRSYQTKIFCKKLNNLK